MPNSAIEFSEGCVLLAEKRNSGCQQQPREASYSQADAVIARLNDGDWSAISELSAIFKEGVTFFLDRAGEKRWSGQADLVRSIVIGVGKEALAGHVVTGREAARAILREIREAVRVRKPGSAFQSESSSRELLADRLAMLSVVERDVLLRFFAKGQSVEHIGDALGLEEHRILELTKRMRKGASGAVSTRNFTAHAAG